MAATVSDVDFDSVQDLDPPFTRQVTITVASGDTRAVAFLTTANFPGGSVVSVTFNGSAMTEITGSPYSSGDGDWSISGYYFDVSGLGAGNYVCQATITGGSDPNDGVFVCAVLASAGDPTGWAEDTDTGTAIDITVSTAADGVAFWVVLQDVDATLSPNGGETEICDAQFSGPGTWYYTSAYYKATSGLSTVSNIGLDSVQWRGVGVFVPGAGGGGGGVSIAWLRA